MRRNVVQIACLLSCLFAPSPAAAMPYVLEVREPNALDPPFSRYVYLCSACTLAQFADVVAPAGFEKAGAKVFVPDEAVTAPTSPPAGVTPSLDLVLDIPGDDFFYVAQVLTAEIVALNATFGVFTLAQVERDTEFTYDAGRVVHEVHDPDGNTYVLFSFDEAVSNVVDLGLLDALGTFPLPAGWSYSSRVLGQDLVVASGGVAHVFGQGSVASWQRVAPVPEPGTALLVALGLAGLALRRPLASRR